MPTRREIMRGLAACLPASLAAACGKPTPATVAPTATATPPPGPRTMLVLGGTRFLGPAIVDAAVADGWEVTLFNRGKSDPGLYPDLEALVGDRDPEVGDGLAALRDRQFTAVVDTSGYFPRHVAASAKLLADHVEHYVFVSSVSAYATHETPGADESDTLAVLDDPTVETMGEDFGNYGGLKVLCERAAEAAMPGRVTNVRPGFIVGPRDPTDRFTYWPVRYARGGRMLVPGTPSDPIQIIDVRDLGAWLVRLCADQRTGVFNAVGPGTPLSMGDVLAACGEGIATPPELTWVDAAFLEEAAERAKAAGKGPAGGLPIWVPPTGESAGFHRRSNAKAVAAGLVFRGVQDTVADTRAWFYSEPAERQTQLRAGISPSDEAELLAAFAAAARTAA
jgi:2'-hydroxyisoflavone reductase